MRKQQEIELDAVGFPISGCFAVVLFFNNNFLRLEPCKLKNAHCFKCKGLHHALFAHIAHQDGAKLVLFQNAMKLLRHLAHFK